MQLMNNKNLKSMLTGATCALLGTPAAQAGALDDWQFDTALMYYGESDRVTAVEGIVAGKKVFDNDQLLNLKLTVDTLTGASANGAVPQPDVQTFTRPSGHDVYDVAAGETPLDDTFRDTRLQLTGSWTQPIAEHLDWTIGGNLSKEYDYLSASINSSLSRSFNKNNTVLSAGLSYAFDQIEPEGGIPRPFAAMPVTSFGSPAFDDQFDASRISADDDKTTIDLLLGISQVINRRMIVQANYSYSSVDGYLTDPFKVLSSVDGSSGLTQQYLYEHRPDSRSKHAFFFQSKYHFDAGILDSSYRFMTDDWGIDSHTVDLRYRFPFSNGHYIEPHLRYYMQGAADFYRPFLIEGEALPDYASADYRIGEMDAYTLGIKYGIPLSGGKQLAFRLEYYKQSPSSDGTSAVGVLNDLDLYPEVDAIIAQLSYSF